MVTITKTGYTIDVTTAAPFEDLQLLTHGLLQLLCDNEIDYCDNVKSPIFWFLQHIQPTHKQLENGLTAV